jgi:hypothetical protein
MRRYKSLREMVSESLIKNAALHTKLTEFSGICRVQEYEEYSFLGRQHLP